MQLFHMAWNFILAIAPGKCSSDHDQMLFYGSPDYLLLHSKQMTALTRKSKKIDTIVTVTVGALVSGVCLI